MMMSCGRERRAAANERLHHSGDIHPSLSTQTAASCAQRCPTYHPVHVRFMLCASCADVMDALGRSESLWQRATSPASMARSERRTRHGPRSWAGVIHASRRALAVAWPALYVIYEASTVAAAIVSTKYLPPTVGVDGMSRYLAVHDESRFFVTYCVLSS